MVLSEARTRTPKLVPNVPDARAFRLSTTEGFLLSCVDGLTTESDLALVTGRDQEEVRATLSKLESLGLVTIEETPVRPRATPSRPPFASTSIPVGAPRGSHPVTGDGSPKPTPLPKSLGLSDDIAAMGEDVDLDPTLREDLLSRYRTLDQLDHYALLGIQPGADKKTTKRAYYELAAKFHPDRYFRKRLGTFKVRMEAVFSRLTLALETLSVAEKRAEYDSYLDEQRRLRGIESVLAGAAAEVQRARASIEREVRAEEPTPLAPTVAPWTPSVLPGAHATPNPAPFLSEIDPAARREALARRLLGGRTSNASMPAPARPSTPPSPHPSITTANAMDALRRRYEERVAAARGAEAKKYAARAEAASRTNQVAAAASAFEVASGLAPHDDDLRRKAASARAEADSMLGQTYRKQAEYEEKNGQWAEAARSWVGACKARPNDAEAHERAATAILNAGGEIAGALELAHRACTREDLPGHRPGLERET
jgi:curved DNA-binding protein CbpA